MSKYLIIEYRNGRHNNDSIHSYFVHGLLKLTETINMAKTDQLNVVEAEDFINDECDIKSYANSFGCILIFNVSTTK